MTFISLHLHPVRPRHLSRHGAVGMAVAVLVYIDAIVGICVGVDVDGNGPVARADSTIRDEGLHCLFVDVFEHEDHGLLPTQLVHPADIESAAPAENYTLRTRAMAWSMSASTDVEVVLINAPETGFPRSGVA